MTCNKGGDAAMRPIHTLNEKTENQCGRMWSDVVRCGLKWSDVFRCSN